MSQQYFTMFEMAWKSLFPIAVAGAVFGGLWLVDWPAALGAKGVVAGTAMLCTWLFVLK